MNNIQALLIAQRYPLMICSLYQHKEEFNNITHFTKKVKTLKLIANLTNES